MSEEKTAPGAVIAIQKFGDLFGFNLHFHVLCTEGWFQERNISDES